MNLNFTLIKQPHFRILAWLDNGNGDILLIITCGLITEMHWCRTWTHRVVLPLMMITWIIYIYLFWRSTLTDILLIVFFYLCVVFSFAESLEAGVIYKSLKITLFDCSYTICVIIAIAGCCICDVFAIAGCCICDFDYSIESSISSGLYNIFLIMPFLTQI